MTEPGLYDARALSVLLYGLIRNRATREPVAGARVGLGASLGQPGEAVLTEAVTDSEGGFHFAGHPGYEPAHQWGVQAGNRYRFSGSASTWNLVEDVTLGLLPLRRMAFLDPVTQLSGTVRIGDQPAGKDLAIHVACGGQVLPAVTTDATGRFSLSDSPTDCFGFGRYPPGSSPSVLLTLTAVGPDGSSCPVEVLLRPGACVDVTIRL